MDTGILKVLSCFWSKYQSQGFCFLFIISWQFLVTWYLQESGLYNLQTLRSWHSVQLGVRYRDRVSLGIFWGLACELPAQTKETQLDLWRPRELWTLVMKPAFITFNIIIYREWIYTSIMGQSCIITLVEKSPFKGSKTLRMSIKSRIPGSFLTSI